MEFLLFLCFTIFSLAALLLVKYFSRLLGDRSKSEFAREEITGVGRIITSELTGMIEESGGMIALLPFATAVFLTWLWTLAGGIIGSPHFTSEPGNYFFHSFLILLFTVTFHQAIYEFALHKLAGGMKTSLVSAFFRPGKMILAGVASALTAANLTTYGMYHEIWFIFILTNLVISFFLSVTYLNDNYPQKLIYPFINRAEYETEEPEFDLDGDSEDEFAGERTSEFQEDFSDEEFKV